MTENSTNLLISIIVPVYNGECFLAEALHSIITQDYRPIQLLVVDDGSTDGTARVANSFPEVRLLHKPHSGISSTLNHGVRHAAGQLIAFLDADDRWLPGKLSRQAAELAQHPELDMVFAHSRQFTTRANGTNNRDYIIAAQPGISKTSLLIRSSSFWQVGEFTQQHGLHDFLDWYARAQAAGLRHTVLADVFVERRIHHHNFGIVNLAHQRNAYLNTLRENLRRQRQESTKGNQNPD